MRGAGAKLSWIRWGWRGAEYLWGCDGSVGVSGAAWVKGCNIRTGDDVTHNIVLILTKK